jgi:thioredoxin reductase
VARRRFEAALGAGKLTFLPNSQVRAIEAERVVLDVAGQAKVLRNDAVIVCIGGLLPTELLADAGIAVETKYGAA